MRGETRPAGGGAPKGDVDAILGDLGDAAEGHYLAEVLPPLSRAFAALLAGYPQATQISQEDRQSLVTALFHAEAAAEAVLAPTTFAERGRHGFLAAFGLFNRWAEKPGSHARATACPEELKVVLILRIVANDLDTLCAADEMARLGAAIAPEDILLKGRAMPTQAAPAVRLH